MLNFLRCLFGVHDFGPEKDRKCTCKLCGRVVATPCAHEYVPYKEYKKTESDPYFYNSPSRTSTESYLILTKCEKCGDIKQHKVD